MAVNPYKILDISRQFQDLVEAGGALPEGTTTIYYGLNGGRRPEPFIEPHARRLSRISLIPYFGDVALLDVSKEPGEEISFAMLEPLMDPFLSGSPEFIPRRFLIKTGAGVHGAKKYLTPDAALYLKALNSALVGLDTTGLDREGENTIKEFFRSNNIVWVLRLDLTNAKPMVRYTINAFPIVPDAVGPCAARVILLEDMRGQT